MGQFVDMIKEIKQSSKQSSLKKIEQATKSKSKLKNKKKSVDEMKNEMKNRMKTLGGQARLRKLQQEIGRLYKTVQNERKLSGRFLKY